MRRASKPLPALAATALLALALAACGDGGGSTTATGSPPAAGTASSGKNGGEATTTAGADRKASDFAPRPHRDSGGGSAQFTVKGADNSIQEFGAEAGEAELRAAAGALHGFLDARAERNWAAACAYLGKAAKQGFARLSAGSERPSACAATLAALSGQVPTATLREAAIADVGSLREEGDRAFLIYRGAPEGSVYAISMSREGDAWKVASLSGVPLG